MNRYPIFMLAALAMASLVLMVLVILGFPG
jgi:hypothetical protein